MHRYSGLIDTFLAAEIDNGVLESRIASAARYSTLSPGKRIRPVLSLTVGAALGIAPNLVLPAACALELLHSASLIHDDLPALDNDDLRRGMPSCHKRFGEATALLTGDALVPFALHLAARGDLPSERRLALVTVLSEAFVRVCNGQQLDLIEEERQRDLTKLYRLKTGALFSAAFQIPVIIAGGSAALQQRAAELGEGIGVAFQQRDDRIDASAEKGRVQGSDVRNHRSTAVKSPISLDVASLFSAFEKRARLEIPTASSFEEIIEILRALDVINCASQQ